MVNTWEEPPYTIHRSWIGANLTGTLAVSDEGVYEIGAEMIQQVCELVRENKNRVSCSSLSAAGSYSIVIIWGLLCCQGEGTAFYGPALGAIAVGRRIEPCKKSHDQM